ncbi:MAG: S41 family peptidase [Sphingobacteriales bacterium]|nr:S41 family peptidase [Sphingobacteriales bacterium]
MMRCCNKIMGKCLVGIFLFISTGCEKAFDVKHPASDPVAVFDEFWNVLDQHYSLFSIKSINWADEYAVYRVKVNNNTSSDSLFRVLTQMSATLKDGHVTLFTARDTFTYIGFFTDYPANFNYNNILHNYLNDVYKVNGPLIYKQVDNIGYIYYSSFAYGVADADIDNTLNDLSHTKGLIIDVRNNTGGNVLNADKIFSRFITQKMLVKYEKIKKGTGHNDFYDPEPHYVSPAGKAYTNPVVVLTNRHCFSACNDFVLYMSQLSNVKIVGDRTGGGGSVPYNYLLSNGWKFQYSATITLSPQKEPIESGIVPDQYIQISQTDDNNGKDPIIENAFAYLN